MLISKLVKLSLVLGLLPAVAQAECETRDFLELALPDHSTRDPRAIALELGYPGLVFEDTTNTVRVSGATIPLGALSSDIAKERLRAATLADTFAQIYPLALDPSMRLTPWFDPGRVRHDPFLKALYGSSEADVARQTRRVIYPEGRARFAVTSAQCVAAQLQAALQAIADEGPEMAPVFTTVGGGFNWRTIAGTKRLSAHSFGIAVDFNTQLGGYWRWSGASEGAVGGYEMPYPEALVRHMERFGFIWGGKWHHFDGMHFEYRPELILHARLSGA